LSTPLQRLPRRRWVPILGAALAVAVLTGVGLELDLAHEGFRPNLADSFPLWERQRQRVDRLGSRAVVLVGDSRVLIVLDLSELRGRTGLEPVQLGVGGASFLPVLQDLAKDPEANGTLLVNFEPQELRPVGNDPAAAYEAQRLPSEGGHGWDFADAEAVLTDQLHAHLRSYADGARPLASLLLRAADTTAMKQYVMTLPDRELVADFSLAKLPRLYYVRAIDEFRLPPPIPHHASLEQQRQAIESGIAALGPDDASAYRPRLAMLAQLVAAIQQHGGKVIFIRLPRTGYLREIDDTRFPHSWAWDPLTTWRGVQTLNFEDVPALDRFDCPDGSHLDMRSRTAFTAALVQALHLQGGP
jgi:hypothetical protein